jgi:CDGSH iron-sulfur domain-containing protein 3
MTASDRPTDAPPPSGSRTPPGTVTVRCRENGPLVVELPADASLELQVTDHLGNPFPLPTGKRAVALCRCGQTATRPFCDGSHRGHGFSAGDIAPPPP